MSFSGKPRDLAYRDDINGLRGIAVLAVLGFHLDISAFKGGFVGVDIFFVISGYLISQMIHQEVIETARFDISRFFVRRVQRLFPALLATCLVSLAAASALFTPSDLDRAGLSAISALFGVSNVLFWLEADYFDASAILKPFLHTWSLSVEAQFYLVWPFVAGMLFSRCTKTIQVLLIATLGILSFAAIRVFEDGFGLFQLIADFFDGQWELMSDGFSFLHEHLSRGAPTTFYLLPFRVVEFMAGAAIIHFNSSEALGKPARWVAFLSGLAVVAYSVFFYNEDSSRQSTFSIIACLGTALLILAKDPGERYSLLNNFVFRRVGYVSYSLYLVHWPVIVFYKYLAQRPITILDYIILVPLIGCLTLILYSYVENKYRQKTASNQNRWLAISSVIAIVGLGFVIHQTRGLPQRVTAALILPERDYKPCENWDETPCIITRGKGSDIIWLGDSLAQHFIPALRQDREGNHLLYYSGGCPMMPIVTRISQNQISKKCLSDKKRAYRQLADRDASTLVLSMYWQAYFGDETDIVALDNAQNWREIYSSKTDLLITALTELARLSQRSGHRVVLLDHIRFDDHEVTYRCANTPINLCRRKRGYDTQFGLMSESPLRSAEVQSKLKELNITYIDYSPNFCEGTVCNVFNNGTDILMYDAIHFTAKGAETALSGPSQNVLSTLTEIGTPN